MFHSFQIEVVSLFYFFGWNVKFIYQQKKKFVVQSSLKSENNQMLKEDGATRSCPTT